MQTFDMDADQIAARLDRFEIWPFPRSVTALVATAIFFAYFDIANIGTVLPRVIATFGVSTHTAAEVVGLGLWGYMAGALLGSLVADRHGRKSAFFFAVSSYGLGSLMTSLSSSLVEFSAFRFLSGLGIGATIGIVTIFVSEMTPPKVRGRYMARTMFPALCGLAVVPALSLWIVPYLTIGWRLILSVPAMGAMCFVAGMGWLPESPRWLAARGRIEEADRIVTAAEVFVIGKTSQPLPPIRIPTPPARHTPPGPWVAFSRKVAPWTILFLAIWFVNYIVSYAVIGMGITLLTEHGVSLEKSIQLTLGASAGVLLGGSLAPWVADRMPRRWPAMGVSVMAGASLVALGIHPSSIMVAITYFLLGVHGGIFAPLVYLLTAEHFPTSGAATGFAVSNGIGHVGGAAGPILVVMMDRSLGFNAAWMSLGILMFALAAALLLTRDTTGMSLGAVARSNSPTGAEAESARSR